MSVQLPIPITFRLPEGWAAADPDQAGAPQAAFVAIDPRDGDRFTPNITVTAVPKRPDWSMVDAAEESVRALAHNADVAVTHRFVFGSDAAPGLTQSVRLTTTVDDVRLDLVQVHFLMTCRDTEDGAKQALLKIVLTATVDQAPTAQRDFERFLATLRATRRTRSGMTDDVLPSYRRVSAETLRLATETTGAPPHLRDLARAVRGGLTTWSEIVDGEADHLPEVKAVNAAVVNRALIERAERPERDDDEGEEPLEGRVFSGRW